ncbi:MAG: hypothetical protein ACXABG_12570 [Promethearchaeota archaeon]
MSDNFLEELKRALYEYKRNNYVFGLYGTGDQIRDAFSDGKIYVMLASNRVWVLLCFLFLPLAVLIPFMGREYFLLVFYSVGMVFLIFDIFLIILFFLYRRIFLIIGPLGVYYQKILKKGYFHWTQATITKIGIEDVKGRYGQTMDTTAIVKVLIQNGKKVKFISNQYRNKEFVKHVKKIMFLRLFQIYSELGRD